MRGLLRFRLWMLLVVAASVAIGCSLPAKAERTAARARAKQLTENAWIRRTIAHMTLPEEVGQLFFVNGYGTTIRDSDPAMVKLNRDYYGVDNIEQLINKFHPGGVIYFAWTNNLQSPAQIVGLSNEIQQTALRQPTPVPMLINTDQEQGIVLRIGTPLTVFPGNMALGATREEALAHRAAVITGIELRSLGINMDNAPVLDVNVEPRNQADGVRAYGDQTPFVSAFGAAQVSGYQTDQGTTGVAATAKHFPGLGDTTIHSDFGVAISPQTLEEIKQIDLPPFKAAITAGLDQVMAGFIVFPKVTGPNVTTSLSPFYINGLLRTYLGYQGAVITDGLDAKALHDYTPEEIALKSIEAGDDELLEIAQYNPPTIDKTPGDLVPAYNALLHAVRTGRITKRRLDLSVTRILRVKWRLGLVRSPFTDPNEWMRVVGTPDHQAVATDASQRSITLIRNNAGLLPLAAGVSKKVLVTGFGNTTTATLGQDIAARGLTPQVMATGSNPSPSVIDSAVAAANQSDLVVVSTYNAWVSQGQLNLVNALLQTGKPVVVVAVGTPYDVAYLPGASTFLTTYDYQPVSLHAAVKVLFGEAKPQGKLPVTIVLYPFGYGL